MPATDFGGCKPAGVILAGGRSRRMGGDHKALMPLAGKPMLQRVIDRVTPQVSDLVLSVEQPSAALGVFGLRQVTDPKPDAGPLAGLLIALQSMNPKHDWLLLVPCDAPFLPVDLATGLLECARNKELPAAVVRYKSETQPTFSIWNRSILQGLEQAVVSEKMTGFKQLISVTEVALLDWPESAPSPFFNINDRQALLEAASLIESETGMPGSC